MTSSGQQLLLISISMLSKKRGEIMEGKRKRKRKNEEEKGKILNFIFLTGYDTL